MLNSKGKGLDSFEGQPSKTRPFFPTIQKKVTLTTCKKYWEGAYLIYLFILSVFSIKVEQKQKSEARAKSFIMAGQPTPGPRTPQK